jgi:predicted nucleic acid-binding protein
VVFVDTSAWFAFFVPDDANHALVQGWFDTFKPPLLTTDYCIDETLTLLVARKRLARALVAGQAFFHRNAARIHFLSQNQIHRAWILFQQRASAGWSFTDCTSKIVMDDLGINVAVALDEHFHQFGNVTVVP